MMIVVITKELRDDYLGTAFLRPKKHFHATNSYMCDAFVLFGSGKST